MAPAIELSKLGRSYGERTALSGVTLTLEPGCTLAVFGANGAGKTTLLRILATLLKPHAGRARADEPVRTLSRGMAQRVAICRVSLHEPELLLLDEPLANLDPGAAEAVEPLIGRTAGPARVVISHDVEQGLTEADLVLGLRAGRAEMLEPAGAVTATDVRRLY